MKVGVRGYVKAGVQWLYAQIRPDLSEHPFEAADGPGISVVSSGGRPCCGGLGVMCVLESSGLSSPKCGLGQILTLLAFGPRQPTTFGPRGTLCSKGPRGDNQLT